jgi:hypothetical protein
MVILIKELDFSAIDQETLIIVVVGIGIVFFALTAISLFFKYVITAALRLSFRWETIRSGRHRESLKLPDIPGDVNAAIAMALYLYLNETHDEESDVITVKRVSRTYSPWSSKLYNMKNIR